MGSGGVGGFIGSRLLQTGQEVTFVARGPHLQTIRDHGLSMLSEDGSRQVLNVNAVEHPKDAASKPDLIIFAVKCYDTKPAAQLLRPAISDQTAVLTLQNGIDSVPTLSSILGADHIIGGATWLTAHILEPGVIEYQDAEVRAAIGEPAGGISNRVQTIAQALRAAGIETEVSDHINHVLWNKLVLLAVLGLVTAACQLPSAPSSPPGACSTSSAPCSTKPSPSPDPRASTSPTPPPTTSSPSSSPSRPTTPPHSRSTSPTSAASSSTTPPAPSSAAPNNPESPPPPSKPST